MPQMSNLDWLMLMFYFILLYIISLFMINNLINNLILFLTNFKESTYLMKSYFNYKWF